MVARRLLKSFLVACLFFVIIFVVTVIKIITPAKNISVTSSVPELQIHLKDKNELVRYLDEKYGFWNKNVIFYYKTPDKKYTTNSIKINIVSKVSQPFTEQQNPNGTTIISTGMELTENGEIVINIAPGDPLKNMAKQDKAIWINAEFWRAINLLTTINFEPKSSLSAAGIKPYPQSDPEKQVFEIND